MSEVAREFGCCVSRVLLTVLVTVLPVSLVHGVSLRVSSIQSNGWVRIAGEGATNGVVTLQGSSNLVHWQTIAVLHGEKFEFADPVARNLRNRFYRFSATARTPTNDWKNQILGPSPLRHGEIEPFLAGHDWVKFAIIMDDPTRVYYASGSHYSFHYDFATRRLAPFTGLELAEFERLALYNEGREVILGAVILPGPGAQTPEFGVQFVSRDPLPREVVRDLFELVKSTVVGPADTRAFYFPTFEQLQMAEEDRSWLESNGVVIASSERWFAGNECYSFGWTIGTLKFFAAREIEAAYADGRLRPEDILLTDGVPAEIPHVAGLLTLTPTTSSSHAVILARAYGVPVVYVLDAALRARAYQLVGQEVAFEIFKDMRDAPRCAVGLYSLDSSFDPALKAEILALKNTPALEISPIARYGAYTAPVDNLVPADIRFFGGKAANYGLLWRTIPSNTLPAIAISFDLWNEFMGQTLASGKTLREEISNRLAGLTYPADIAAIKTNLNGIRSLVRTSTAFTTNQQQAIISALRVFDSRRNIRFRSSTNVEDTESFTGAGLYDSYSGCLDDDLDGDGRGPSHCDGTEDDERGVFRAIARVYASFYNDNAYLERLRRGVDENLVGMAVLVHHSTPDPIEMANGVATVQRSADGYFRAELSTQKGAVPVANPDGSALPEIVSAGEYGSVGVIQHSTLLPLGGYVMDWPTNYQHLAQLLFAVARGYASLTGKDAFLLDFEYKKVEPGWLEVKQVRELPLPPAAVSNRYLINAPMVLVPRQGVQEGRLTDIFATHRLKSRWTLHTHNLRLDTTNLTRPFVRHVTIEHLNSNGIERLSVPVEDLDGFSYLPSDPGFAGRPRHRWRMQTLDGPATMSLYVVFDDDNDSMFQYAGVRRPYVAATYDHPVPPPLWGESEWRTNEAVWLERAVDPSTIANARRLDHGGTFNLNGRIFTISVSSDHGMAGDNPWLVGNLQTRIEGLTSEPIVLTNFFSQTAANTHFSSVHSYILEPRIEPGISTSILNELEALDIRMFSFRSGAPGEAGPGLEIIGRDREPRGVPAITSSP